MDRNVKSSPLSTKDESPGSMQANVIVQEANEDTEISACSQQGCGPTPLSASAPQSFYLASMESSNNIDQRDDNVSNLSILMMSRPHQSSKPSTAEVIPTLYINSPKSNVSKTYTTPQSLFHQALTTLGSNSLGFAVVERLKAELDTTTREINNKLEDLSPPESLMSAPPSYSFVLRQLERRRPRIMGTFIPSPSFIRQTPPPNYAGAFDVYIDHPPRPQPRRAYTFGFNPIPVICHQCGYFGLTDVVCKVTICTHLCATLLCLFCCWFCVPLPYVLRSCKDVYHYCKNCKMFLGMYCPSNPEATYSGGMSCNPNLARTA